VSDSCAAGSVFWQEQFCLNQARKSKRSKYDELRSNQSWNQFTGKVKEKWGKLTADDLTTIAGQRDQMIGIPQERYGCARERAEQE